MIQFLADNANPSSLGMFLPIILLFVLMYFVMIRPQKKQEKQIADMRNSIMIGDEICTNGGIIGRVCAIKDDILTLEINKDRTKMKIYRWAVHEIVNPMPRPEAEKAQETKKADRKADKKDKPELKD